MNLNAEVNVGTRAAERNLLALARASEYASKAFREGNFAIESYANMQPKLAAAVKTSQTAILAAELNTARVRKITAETEFTQRKTKIAMSEAQARAVQRNEAAEQKAIRETAAARKAANTDANPGAVSKIPTGYLQNKAVGLPTENLNLPDVGSLNQTRYALYDVATTLGVFGTAAVAAGSSTLVFATQYQSAMAQLERVTQLDKASTELASIKNQILDLSESIPVGFTDLADIAALGAQLGIANEDLGTFTETVAQFSAITGVSTEKVAQDFGALAQIIKVPTNEFQNLGSAINYAGVTSVSTDAEILNMATAIGAATTQAGYLSFQTVGLASALASLRIQPEQARGVILRLFSDFDRVVSEGGTKLAEYASIMDTTSEKAAALWNDKANGGPEKFFDALVKGLGATENLNGALTQLGIVETRERNVLQRLAGNYDVLSTSMDNSAQSYAEGTFQAESYATVSQTVAAKIQLLLNTISNLGAKAGDALLPGFAFIIDTAINLVKVIGAIPAPVLSALSAFALLAGGLTLAVAGAAAFAASAFAVQTALTGLKANAADAGVSGLGLRSIITQLTQALGINSAAARINARTIGTLPGVQAAAAGTSRALALAQIQTGGALNGAAVAARGFGSALLAVPLVNVIAAASILLPILFSIAGAMDQQKNAAREAGQALATAGGGMDSFREAITADTEAVTNGATAYGSYSTKVTEADKAKQADAAAAANTAKNIRVLTGEQGALTSSLETVSSGIQEQTKYLGSNATEWIRKALAENESLQNLAKSDGKLALFQKFGGDIDKAIKLGLKQDGSLEKYFDEINSNAFQQINGEGFISDALFGGNKASITGDLNGIKDSINGIVLEAQTTDKIGTLLGIPPAIDDAETLNGAILEISDSLNKAFLQGSTKFFGYGDMISGIQEARKAVAEADAEIRRENGETEASWEQTYNGIDVTIQEFMASLDTQIAKQSAWATDVSTLADRGATAFVTELATMGPEGAALARQAVDLSTEELNKLEVNARIAGFLASNAYLQGVESNNALLAEAWSRGGLEAVRAMVEAQVSGAPGAVQEVINKYNLELAANQMKIQADSTDANNELQQFVNRVNGTRATMRFFAEPVGTGTVLKPSGSANGNLYAKGKAQAFANGGFPSGIYKGRTAAIHKFAEKETKWEAYISGKPGQEERNRRIWGEAGKRLGIDAAPAMATASFNRGGIAASYNTSAPVNQAIPGSNSRPREVISYASPADRALMRQASNTTRVIQLVADGRVLATVVDAANENNQFTGSN